MTTVLLGQSYYLRFDPKEWEAMKPYPPLGTMYAASFLRQHGYDVRFFDAMLAASEAEWAAALDAHRPEYAVIYEDGFNYLSKMCLTRMRDAAFTMARAAKARGCTVLVSGSDATDHKEKYFANGVDGVIVGEGEVTLVEALNSFSNRSETSVEEIAGLSVPGKHEGQSRGYLRQLDEVPFPAWDLIDVDRYRQIWKARHGYYSMNMVTTRGCPYHCNWCAKPIYGQRYNVRSAKNVAAELKWLKDEYRPDHIWFADDIFGLKPGWIERFGIEIERLDTKTPFKCLLRVDLIKPGVPEGLKKAGCEIVWVGAESGSQKVLDAMDKGTKVEQIYAAARNLHAQGIKIAFFLQFGYPGEDRNDIEATLQMVRDCEPDDVGVSVSYPLPGTKFYDSVKTQLGDKQNWLNSADLAMMYRGPFSTDFYRQLHTVLHKEYRAHKGWRQIRNRESGQMGLGSRLKVGARVARNFMTLPLERYKLDRLAHQTSDGIHHLPPLMTPEAAATPSAQAE